MHKCEHHKHPIAHRVTCCNTVCRRQEATSRTNASITNTEVEREAEAREYARVVLDHLSKVCFCMRSPPPHARMHARALARTHAHTTTTYHTTPTHHVRPRTHRTQGERG
jgi:hypothetical protein